ncbi:hypothetical protein OOJ09_27390 [Mesorhizobium qingshengii]|uniref:Uncharacterized protein n=1 Tax=Mesorhizobium qingshengii TaxID=1165689 RepID=A0ABT4R245_9HYPH|nr:hypothetical protein [Mesorhizobium qingshengii]MCZ8547919.1 hypothetical protein [Mesorhizobium qingshengii]
MIVASRADASLLSTDDLWRRGDVLAASLVQLAEADAFLPDLNLARHQRAAGRTFPCLWPALVMWRSSRNMPQLFV